MNLAALWSEGWTSALLNHLWQSTVIVGIAWMLAWALRRNRARARYAVWMVASVKFLVPFSLLMMAGEWLRSLMPATAVARPAVAAAMEQVALPFGDDEVIVALPPQVAVHHANWLPWALFAVWACGVMVVVARIARGWWKVYATKRAARPLGVTRSVEWFGSNEKTTADPSFRLPRIRKANTGPQAHSTQDDRRYFSSGVGGTTQATPAAKFRRRGPREVVSFHGCDFADASGNRMQDLPVLISPTLIEPGIFGIFRPVLLLPEGILERLTAEQMRAIVAHEMSHVRRRDNLTFAIHMIAETLFWFHPAVWWIGARLIEEREQACDEAVVEAGGEAQAYAEGILNVCKFYVESPLECVAGVTGADLKKRIVRIMTERNLLRLDWRKKLILAAAALLMAAVPVTLGLGQAAQSAALTADITGIWQGTLHIAQANRDLRTEIKIAKNADGSYKLTFYSIDQGGQPLVADKTAFESGKLTFTMDVVGGKYEGTLSPDGKTITGTWTQGPNPVALNLERTAEEAAWPIPEPIKPMSPDAHPNLEVATIKPSQPGARGKGFGFNGTHFRAVNFDVNDMIAVGFGLDAKQIIGAPDWLATDLFDIDGVPDAPGRPNIKQQGEMLQGLLTDRFALKFHREQRELPVYAIQLAPGGPKMKETTAAANDQQAFGFRGLGDLVVRNMSMKDFAFGMQSAVTDRPVVDQTGLTARYDFTLKWTPDDSQFAQFRGVVAPTPPAAGDNPNAPPSLYTAMQETLGLKFTATKAQDDVIVIDHVEKPSPN